MNKINDSFAVLGLSTFGYRTAVSLYEAGAAVIAVDRDEKLVNRISPFVTKAVAADLMDASALQHIGALEVDTVIVGLRSSFDVATLLIHMYKKQTKVKKIVAQVDTSEKADVLKLVGADIVVFPEKDMADWVVRHLAVPNLVEQISLHSDKAIVEVPIPRRFMGKSLIDLQIRAKYNVYVIGIKRADEKKPDKVDVTIAPSPQTKFQEGDAILILGDLEDLNRFMKETS